MKLRDYKYSKLFFGIWVAFLVFWMCFIFSNSLATATESNSASKGVVETIEEVVQTVYPEFEVSNHFVRKLAHYVEFFVLATIFVLSYYIIKRELKYHITLSLLFGVVVSLIDETIQLSTAGRAGMIKDVWIDFSAVVTSVLIFVLVNILLERKKSL